MVVWLKQTKNYIWNWALKDIFSSQVFFDKKHSRPPGKYPWQDLLKNPRHSFFLIPPFSKCGNESGPPHRKEGGWYCGKCDKFHKKQRVWSNLTTKTLIEKFFVGSLQRKNTLKVSVTRFMNNSIIVNYERISFCCYLITDVTPKIFLVLNLSPNLLEFLKDLRINIGDKDHFIRDKEFKNGPSKTCGRQPLKTVQW